MIFQQKQNSFKLFRLGTIFLELYRVDRYDYINGTHLSSQILFSCWRKAQQPQGGVRHSLQDTHPSVKYRGIDFEQLVEVAEEKFVLRQTCAVYFKEKEHHMKSEKEEEKT